MKFNTIFVLFNVIIIASFLFIFLMPLFIIGAGQASIFWGQNWYMIVIFVLIIAGLDSYFLKNRRVFQSLEQEDWTGLSRLLEKRVLVRGRFTDQDVRLLANSYFVQGKPGDIAKLRDPIEKKGREAMLKHANLLLVPYLLNSDMQGLHDFLQPIAGDVKGRNRHWVLFFRALSLANLKRETEALAELELLACDPSYRITQLLSLYILVSSAYIDIADAPRAQKIIAAKDAFPLACSRLQFSKLMSREQDSHEILIIKQMFAQAVEWMYSGAAASAPAARDGAGTAGAL